MAIRNAVLIKWMIYRIFKVLSPAAFRKQIAEEISKMNERYR